MIVRFSAEMVFQLGEVRRLQQDDLLKITNLLINFMVLIEYLLCVTGIDLSLTYK